MIEGKSVLITGAASGMGYEAVKLFTRSRKYSPIYAVDINPRISEMFPKRFPQIKPMQVDVSDGAQTAEMFDRVRKETERLDVLVNCAGKIIAGDPTNPISQAQVRELEETNYVGQQKIMFWAEIMMESQGGGTIINITSSKDYFPDPYRFQYMMSKFRFEDMSLDARRRHKADEDGVNIVVVKPGNMKTNIDHGDWTAGYSPEEIEAVQNFNDWWRRTFGGNPKSVGRAIYQIAEGEIDKDKVHVGWDAKLGNVLAKAPYWRPAFFLTSMGVYEAVKLAHTFQSKSRVENS